MTTFLQKYLAQFNLETIGMKLLSLVGLYILFWCAKKIIQFFIKRALKSSLPIGIRDSNRQKTLIRLMENLLNYALFFFLIYSVLATFGLPVSSLLAGAGIAGVAIGLGAQGFLSDLVNGFFILIERQFDVGDSVRLTNGPIILSGTVTTVGIRTTQVRDADGTLHFIPNRNILVVSNKSRGDMRVEIDLPLGPTVDLDRVTAVIEAVHQQEIPKQEAIKGVTILGPQLSSTGRFSYRIHLFVTNGEQGQIYHTFYGIYQKALLEAGIEFTPSFQDVIQ